MVAGEREGLIKREKKKLLIQTLPKIFKDRQEAEFAFNLIKDTFSLLKIEKTHDMRFPINFRPGDQYISIDTHDKKGTILGFYKTKTSNFCKMEIVLQADLKGADPNYICFNPDKPEDEPDLRFYRVPIETAILSKEDIIKNYDTALDNLGRKYRKPISCPIPEKENEQKALNEVFLSVIKDSEERDELFQGFKIEFPKNKEYTLSQCSEATSYDNDFLSKMIRAINRKGQIILYGPPGTGKTYLAEKLARHLINDGNGFIEVVQFHPAYAYEDFIQGIRPLSKDGGRLEYPIVPGRFLEFCTNAETRQGNCVLIIDELNRANLAKVFGELMYLLEVSANRRREREMPLASGKKFCIPNNVKIIGTMNTADRSIALVDHALRRRFAFFRISPNYNIIRRYHGRKNTQFPVEGLIEVLERLNSQINDPNYEIGISYFLQERLSEDIDNIWRTEIEPFLEEYYFDRLENVEEFRWEKIKVKVLP